MEHYINIIFNKKITLKSIEETVSIVSDTGRVPLTENEVEYEIFKENNSQIITMPLAEDLSEHKLVEFVNNVANKLFDKGYNDFDIEIGLNEAERLTTFEPWRAEIEAAGYTITSSGTNIKTRDGSGTVAGINDNGNLWSGSRTITDIVRGNSAGAGAETPAAPEPSPATTPDEMQGDDALQQFAQSDQRGLANNPEQRAAITQLQQRLIDAGYDLGPQGADGIYGSRTIAAVRAYQEANNLTPDGDAGPETIGSLLSTDSQAAADAAIDRRMDGDAAATRPQDQVDTDMTDQEAQDELVTRLRSRDFVGALAIVDTYPRLRARLSDENYEELQRLAAGTAASTDSSGGDTVEPTDAIPAPGEYVREGDVVVGEDVNTREDGSVNRLDWSLNVPERTVTFTNLTPQRTYEGVYISRRGSNEYVGGMRDGRSIILDQQPLTTLIAAIKEYIEDYNTQPSASRSAVAPEVQATAPEQPAQPEAPETPTVRITGVDNTDIPRLQASLGPAPEMEPQLEPGETSQSTGIRNPTAYGTTLVRGMPNIVFQSLSLLGSDLSVRNAEAFRNTLNFDLLTPDMARAIVRELQRLYPVQQIADAISDGEMSDEETDALHIMLNARVALDNVRTNPAPAESDLEERWNDLRNNGTEQEITDFVSGLSSEEKISLGIDPLASTANDLGIEPNDETPDESVASVREIRNSVREIYNSLGNPSVTPPRPTFVEDVRDALENIENRATWNAVVEAYAERHPIPRQAARRNLVHLTGTLLGDLRNATSEEQWNDFIQPSLDRLGVEETYESSAEATNESISNMKIDDIVDEVTFDDDDKFFENYGVMWFNEDETIDEAEYQGRTVKLGKPMAGDVKKFKVYVKNPKGNVVKVNFGQKGAKIKKNNPERRRSFRARHNCDNPGPRHKARYWSCRKW